VKEVQWHEAVYVSESGGLALVVVGSLVRVLWAGVVSFVGDAVTGVVADLGGFGDMVSTKGSRREERI
jgi:hypothetical protein